MDLVTDSSIRWISRVDKETLENNIYKKVLDVANGPTGSQEFLVYRAGWKDLDNLIEKIEIEQADKILKGRDSVVVVRLCRVFSPIEKGKVAPRPERFSMLLDIARPPCGAIITSSDKIQCEIKEFLNKFLRIKPVELEMGGVSITPEGIKIEIDNCKEKKPMNYPVFTLSGVQDSVTGTVTEISMNPGLLPWEPATVHITGRVNTISPNPKLLVPGLLPWEKDRGTIPPTFQYEKIIYSNGVTTILWKDGTKTTVRPAEGETPDPGAGIAYAFMKKALGNKNGHNKLLRKEVPKVVEAEKRRLKKKEKKNGAKKDS